MSGYFVIRFTVVPEHAFIRPVDGYNENGWLNTNLGNKHYCILYTWITNLRCHYSDGVFSLCSDGALWEMAWEKVAKLVYRRIQRIT